MSPLFAGDTNSDGSLPPQPPEDTTGDALRSFLQLQQQLHATQLAIERGRLEAETIAARNAEALTARLQALETSLGEQRARELDAMRGANRLMVTIGGSCVVVGFLALLLTAYFQWRAVSRLTELSVLSQASLTLGRGALPPPGGVPSLPMGTAIADEANRRLFGALDRLEQRIVGLEQTARPSALVAGTNSSAAPAPASPAPNPSSRMAVLLAKGESLLRAEKPEVAVACYDEILAVAPEHAEALVKKGDALERLGRIDDAIDCYDRAIAADGSLTVAYLHKGGLFNRLERYEEALQCYELALRSQEKSPA